MSTKFDAAVEAAVANCLAHGARTQCEKAILLARDGTVLLERNGESDHVGFTNEEASTMSGKLLIHNHPLSMEYEDVGPSLSSADIMFATTKGVEVWAVTEDGGRYKTHGLTAKGLPRLSTMGVIQNKFGARAAVVRLLGSATTMNSTFTHICNQAFKRLDLIDYRYDESDKMRSKLHDIEDEVARMFEVAKVS